MVPLRAIFEALGATVDWNGETQTVTSTKDDTTISLTIDNPVMNVNGEEVTLDTSACIVDGRTLVPVRAISEAFKLKVDWDNDTKTVKIRKKVAVPIQYFNPLMAYTFLTPITAIAGGFYSVWHNIFNSYQLYRKRKAA